MMNTAAYATEVTASSVNETLKNIQMGYSDVMGMLQLMDSNVLADMDILLRKQMETVDAVNALRETLTVVPTEPVEKVVFHISAQKIALAAGIGYVAYRLYKSKKEK